MSPFNIIPKAKALDLTFQAPYDKYNDGIGIKDIGVGGKIDTSGLGPLIGSLLPYVMVFAGLILLVMLVLGGFTMLSGATNKESQEKAKKQITNALLGFFVIFLAYWIAQILQIVLNIQILG